MIKRTFWSLFNGLQFTEINFYDLEKNEYKLHLKMRKDNVDLPIT